MPPLIPCPACARHVYSNEAECPFCEAALPRPRSAGRGLAAAAGVGLAVLATGCPTERGDAPVAEYGAPPPVAPQDPGATPVAPDDDRMGDAAAEYGAPPPPADDPALDPGFRDDLQAEYGAPPPPRDDAKPGDDPAPQPPR